MGTFDQAVIWLQEGKDITRAGLGDDVLRFDDVEDGVVGNFVTMRYRYVEDRNVRNIKIGRYAWTSEDQQATDWEYKL